MLNYQLEGHIWLRGLEHFIPQPTSALLRTSKSCRFQLLCVIWALGNISSAGGCSIQISIAPWALEMERYKNARVLKELIWDNQIEEEDRRNSLKDVKLVYPSLQAWRIFSLWTFTLFNAMNMWHFLQISQHVNPCSLPKLARYFQIEEISIRKMFLQKGCTGVCWCHCRFDRQQTASPRAPATQKPSRQHSQPRQPTYQQTTGAQGSQTSQNFWIHLFVNQKVLRSEMDLCLFFTCCFFFRGKTLSISFQALKLNIGWDFLKSLKVFGHLTRTAISRDIQGLSWSVCWPNTHRQARVSVWLQKLKAINSG